ncbi:hypothetical protein [Aeromonas jandaei]|uniref:hypothetical protein n=1 Tax=Aeromonas jandaei TaxID=650 RepID=UPI003EC4B349
MLIDNASKTPVPYNINFGLNTLMILKLTSEWGSYRGKLIDSILIEHPDSSNYDENQWRQLFQTYNIEDVGWNWNEKSLHYKAPDYEWFFLTAAQQIQAVLVLYHPKNSRIDGEYISYIDYLASADWNRARPGHKPKFKNSARILLREAARHSTQRLSYRPGFSLHSLPAAEGFYKKLGMIDFGLDTNKENLLYLEAGTGTTQTIMAATYD